MTRSASPNKLKIYEYAGCSTCKKALKFLDEKKVSYERIPIVERPPSIAELKKMTEHLDGNYKKLFNTSGQVYRELGLSDRMGELTLAEALELLSKNGKLVKRPFVLAPAGGVVGFRPEEWERLIK